MNNVLSSDKSPYWLFAQPLPIIVKYLNTIPTKGRKQEVSDEKNVSVVGDSSVGAEVSELCNM